MTEKKLNNWETRLTNHFAELRQDRAPNKKKQPIFALEHGLNKQEIQELERALRTHITDHRLLKEHSLAWIVYSSELGYRYSGIEYWQTFEQKTPGWVERGDRDWLREQFYNFHKEYGGVKPTGLWAKHFSIICWPITHAVIPKDLQRQLARLLYELRNYFSRDLFEFPEQLGKLIAARSWNATSRFQNLTQEKKLLGQIAVALLLQKDSDKEDLIYPMYPATLERIIKDVEQEQKTREWLRNACQFAKERTQVKGLGMLKPSTRDIKIPAKAREEVCALGIEPSLMLRPTSLSMTSWDVSLEIPDLSHLPQRFPEFLPILTESRCVVAGTSDRPLARGRLLQHGTQRVKLTQWPGTSKVLLRFEPSDDLLNCLLRMDCLLRPYPKWLFRVASDGLAYECRSLRVRPGKQYILISTDEHSLQSNSHTRPITLLCKGIYGTILQLPKKLTVDWEKSIQALGLQQAKKIEVWPAGLAAAKWDGEGYGEWFASEQPCLAILADHSVESLLVSMDSNANSPLELTSINPGQPIFVELPQIPVGRHKICVSATSIEGETTQLGDLDIVIREPRPQPPGNVSLQGPLRLHIDPPVPTLEELWEGRVDIALQGPKNRKIKCCVKFLEKDAKTKIFYERLPQIEMPFTASDWRTHFKKLQQKQRFEKIYDLSYICKLEFDAEELGAFTVRCERKFTPLRWTLQRTRNQPILHLLNDSGDSKEPTVSRMTFETPCAPERLSLDPKYPAPNLGAMYVAEIKQFSAAIIVPPFKFDHFKDLCNSPNINKEKRSLKSVSNIVKYADLWGRARLTGSTLSMTHRKKVVDALVHEIFRLICGDHWEKAEAKFLLDNNTKALELLSRTVSDHPKVLGDKLFQETKTLSLKNYKSLIHRLALCTTRDLLKAPDGQECALETDINSPEEWLTDFSLKLASDPAGIKTWAGDRLSPSLKCLLALPTLARAIRFLVLAENYHIQKSPSEDLYRSKEQT